LLASLKELRIKPESIGEYVRLWIYPSFIAGKIQPADVFDEARLKSSMVAGKLKCSASEGMSCVPVLANYCEALLKNPNDAVKHHARLFLMLAQIIGQIFRSGRKLMNKGLLQALTRDYIREYKAVYGEESVVPKFHMLAHLPKFPVDQLPNCFVHERKHKTVKRFANNVFNTSSDWDTSVLREVTQLHCEQMAAAPVSKFSETPGLVKPSPPSRRLKQSLLHVLGHEFAAAKLMTCRTARVNKYDHASVGDLVLLGSADPPIIGRIIYHFSVQVDELQEHASLVEEYIVSEVHHRAWKCKLAGKQTLFDLGDIGTPLIHAGTEVITALKPIHAAAYPGL
jgi:hypothetical protein